LLWQRGLPLRIVLAGPEMPNFRAYWGHFARDSGAKNEHRVVRLGILDENQKRDFFAGIDIFALPSPSDSFGVVLLEACGNGLPNVAYRAGGPADLIRHERDGLLVSCGDVAKLADALELLLNDATLRHELGANGRERCMRELGWEDKLNLVRETMLKSVSVS